MIAVVLIGLSLSMDACAVSISAGVSISGLKKIHIMRAAFFFALFQFAMPVAGFFAGAVFVDYIKSFDHWIAFALLAFIGGKMLLECGKKENALETGAAQSSADIRSIKTLLILAVATSIDALAVGISLSIMDTGTGIFLSAAVIGMVTFVVCILGFEFGKRIGKVLERGAQAAGGIILIGIGAKILLEHLLG